MHLLRQQKREWPWPGDFHLPTFAEFVRRSDYLAQPPLTARQEAAITESIGPSAYEWFCLPRKKTAIWLCWGKGSGKDLLSAELLAYVAYCIGSMVNPWAHFSIPLGETMHCLNVAQDQNAARIVYFERLKRMCKQPCFEPLLKAKKHIGTDEINIRRYIPSLGYEVPCLQLLSLHSRNEAAEGKNTLFWVLDESDALRTADGNRAAEKLLKTLTTSNRFGSRQIGVSISYPREQDGFMLKNVLSCENLGGTVREWHGDRAATYEVLPWKVYIPVRRVGREDWEEISDFRELDGTEFYTNDKWELFVPASGEFAAHGPFAGKWLEPDLEMVRTYRDDPETFDAMYRTQPPAAEGAFFSIPVKIDEAIAKWHKPVAVIDPGNKEVEVTSPDGVVQVYKRVAHSIRELRLNPTYTYFIGGDAGEVQDSFALCLAHIVPPNERGYLCHVCWPDPDRRHLKHYQPKALPFLPDGTPKGDWQPTDWACDCCQRVPTWQKGKPQFWGVCRPAGRMERVPKKVRNADGSPKLTQAGDFVYEWTKDPATGEPVKAMEEVWHPVVVEDLLIEWQPNKPKGITVDFDSVAEVIEAIAAECRLGGCKFDKWNATATIQRLQDKGIPCEAKTFGQADQLVMYGNYKALVYNNRLVLLPGEEKRRTQLRQIVRKNNKIDHPPGGGKDLTDAEALAFLQCCEYAQNIGRIDLGMSFEEHHGHQVMTQAAKKELEPEQPSIVALGLMGVPVIDNRKTEDKVIGTNMGRIL